MKPPLNCAEYHCAACGVTTCSAALFAAHVRVRHGSPTVSIVPTMTRVVPRAFDDDVDALDEYNYEAGTRRVPKRPTLDELDTPPRWKR